MIISVTINGIFLGDMVREDLEIKLKDRGNLEKLLKKVGKKVKINLLYIIKEMISNPVILLNGNRTEFPMDLKKDLKDGDKISILQSLGGG